MRVLCVVRRAVRAWVLMLAVLTCGYLPQSLAATAQVIEYDLQSTSVLRINLPQSQSVTVTTSAAVGKLAVADPAIADAQPITDQSLYLVGKQLGRTTVNILSTEGRPIGLIEIEVGVDTADISRSIRSVVPNSNVHVGTVNGRVRLTGDVPDSETLAQVLAIASQYGSDNMINAISTKGGQQVNLEVRVLEASRDAGKELGVNWGFNSDGFTAASSPATGIGDFVASILQIGNFNLDITINALEGRGVVRTLAEPNLTTLSGQQAKFLAGGEVPVRITGPNGTTIEYKKFGVQLVFTPVVLSDDRIQIKLAPEVSDISGVSPQGDFTFSTRNLESTIELRDGQSFAVAGLLSSSNIRNKNQVPWLGDVPVLGALFSSTKYQKKETELVVVVTPRLVRPNVPGEVASGPLDRSQSSNDAELFLLGQLEVTRDMLTSFQKGIGIAGPFGHILDTE